MSAARIGVLGGGAFGTALAIALARGGQDVTLWARDPAPIAATRESPHLPGCPLPDAVTVTGALDTVAADILLLATPMQSLRGLLARPDFPDAPALVACCKGIDLATGTGPTALIQSAHPDRVAAVLTGPSFAADIARGLPTALTLASADEAAVLALQAQLSTEVLRLYSSTDPLGAELGGALKNVIAIACGAVIGGGFGVSARAALMTRGFVEMQRLATLLGARPQTLTGLSGFGDLVLTCTSEMSRNFAFGVSLGRGEPPDTTRTVEGRATAEAALALAVRHGVDMPITRMVTEMASGRLDAAHAMQVLLAVSQTSTPSQSASEVHAIRQTSSTHALPAAQSASTSHRSVAGSQRACTRTASSSKPASRIAAGSSAASDTSTSPSGTRASRGGRGLAAASIGAFSTPLAEDSNASNR